MKNSHREVLPVRHPVSPNGYIYISIVIVLVFKPLDTTNHSLIFLILVFFFF